MVNGYKRLSLVTLSILLSSALSAAAWASSYCDHLLRLDPAALSAIRPGSNPARRYTNTIPLTPIRDQCSYGGCWIYAEFGELESAIKHFHGKEIDLSEQYHLIVSLRLRALDALKYPGEQVSEGGVVTQAYWLLMNYGLVPSEAWKPRVPFEKGEHATRLMYFLNSRIAQFHIESEAVTDPEELAQLKSKAEKEVLELIEVYSGPLPRDKSPGQEAIEFEFEGKRYTPASFRDRFVPAAPGRVALLFPRKEPLPPVLKQVANNAKPAQLRDVKDTIAPDQWERTYSASIEGIKANLVKRLTRSPDNPDPKPIWIAVEWVSAFIDKKTGIMSVDAFNTPSGFKPPMQAYRQSFGLAGGGHAVDIVDYELNPDGTAKTFLIRNSWNVTSGDQGYYHMDVKGYFDHFFKYTYIFEPEAAPASAPVENTGLKLKRRARR